MLSTVILVLFYVATPALILYLCHKSSFLDKIGAVLLSYFIGLVIGNLGILPESAKQIQELITTITIPLAIPLLLFSSDIKNWFKLAPKAFLSMFLGLIAVIVSVFIGYIVLNDGGVKELWKVGGMLIGVYSGGTPNLASLKLMLDVDDTTYILTHTYDMLICMVYFTFLITIGQKFFQLFLKPFPKDGDKVKEEKAENPYLGLLQKKNLWSLLRVFLVAVLIFGIGGALSLLFSDSAQMTVVIFTITTLGIAASFIPKVKNTKSTFELGMYLILIFSIDVASMADMSMFKAISTELFLYVSIAVFGSLIIHAILAKIFKIDADTMIITSIAMIFSPPFVPLVAGALKNEKIIISGITVGVIGYAIGNYLGFFIAQLLKGF